MCPGDFMFCKWKIAAICLGIFAAGGCQKKAVTAAPPPPRPAAAAAATPAPAPPESNPPKITQFEAEPTSIQRGQSSTLRWEVTGDVASVSIDHTVGVVQTTGTRRVSPGESATYTITASGAGGKITALATINVTAPPPPPPKPRHGRGARSMSALPRTCRMHSSTMAGVKSGSDGARYFGAGRDGAQGHSE